MMLCKQPTAALALLDSCIAYMKVSRVILHIIIGKYSGGICGGALCDDRCTMSNGTVFLYLFSASTTTKLIQTRAPCLGILLAYFTKTRYVSM